MAKYGKKTLIFVLRDFPKKGDQKEYGKIVNENCDEIDRTLRETFNVKYVCMPSYEHEVEFASYAKAIYNFIKSLKSQYKN